MRNPNGYGSVYKLSGNRRKPWVARVTIGWKTNEKSMTALPVFHYVGYYATRSEALKALAHYNGEEDTKAPKVTLERLYKEWSAEHFPTMKSTGIYTSSITVVSALFSRSVDSLTIKDFEEAIRASGRTQSAAVKLKNALKLMYRFGYRKGYVDEKKAMLPTFINTGIAKASAVHQKHQAFTKEELESLWMSKDDEHVQVVLFLIYTGLRISELIHLKPEDVDLENRCLFIREAKTSAGVRTVPIADRIMFIASKWLKRNDGNFAPIDKRAGHYGENEFAETTARVCGMRHLCHDTRYTTATLLTECSVDLRFIKLILGHSRGDVTNDVYAEKIDPRVLLESINRI